MKSDFLIALTQLAAERHLPKEQVLQAIEVALASAFKKDNPASGQNISVKLNPNTGDVNVYALKTVVDVIEDPAREISLTDAQYIQKGVAIGEEASPVCGLKITSSLPRNPRVKSGGDASNKEILSGSVLQGRGPLKTLRIRCYTDLVI